MSKPRRDVNKVQIGYHRAENTETVSSPHTYAYSSGKSVPSTTKPDKPTVSNIRIASAVAGLPPSRFAANAPVKREKNDEESESATAAASSASSSLLHGAASEARTTVDGFPWSTRRVERMSFEMQNVSPPISNLFRRVLTTEVPTLAFDRVLIEENDSPVLDELLSHRLGLVPVAGPVMKMHYITESNQASFSNLDPSRVLLFELDATGAKDAAVTPVYSRQLQWVPLPGQDKKTGAVAGACQTGREEYAGAAGATEHSADDDDDAVFLVHPDILLSKLGPGQRIKLKAIAVKGLGAVHAKWSPVSACYYEMKTSVELCERLTGSAAEALVKSCPAGVFGYEGGQKGAAATVVAPEKCTLCRECLRSDDKGAEAAASEGDRVRVQKEKTHVLFHIESVGQLHPAQILRFGLRLFAERCRALAEMVQSTEVRVADASAKSLEL
ncbi:RNA polymerase subunit / RPAC1 / RPC40 [Leishmania donovani]|uniref:Plastid-encoded RNA polymerase subunit alpha n=3 Tax=Leishmania donovani species complex TaxID=38574 RepID=A0A6L0XEY9_LEIIN|nr:putative DNA-directed RNA polymerase, alpha subunit [Leishmania infantum JPCM5]CAC9482815.1 DNA-directed_RNA_polymerases_I_and_III_subunit_RPAC1_-_putative [Leishmania infantum]CAJ1988181.1 RNA polymerase subunit / RPAC1 / RPC40 [Leishmania donovani]CAM67271.1 putative DNA-directed RNA polymerase, alpha subunit [Leishmania infantum JPCM5]SUZ41163.1 DNA-directed_RNA_polymerases_I_and_III_subunit_RPAC1_-_putative [Leishmania infantum]VDZ44068.1 DNA-directed_RNA_polymerases_I_and_III_subunit_R|eukprot:XP_001465028.1 putative DNA-directed RNA polymerase, alpha subunit [Leishmania infantum JPCM5]